jgi:glycosyltransferase involved in cell wall biosynthesis
MLHYTAPPVVGGVEAVMTEHARLCAAAGYPTRLIVGRGGESGLPGGVEPQVIPEIDSEHPDNLEIAAALERGEAPPAFAALRARIEAALTPALAQADVVIAHNVMHMPFNLPLTAALHRRLDRGAPPRFISWCHDVSRHVQPSSGAARRSGHPWDLLRTYRPEMTYVAVSAQRQRLLAEVLHCPRERIHVVPNGVDPVSLLGLSDLGQTLAEAFGLLEADLVLLMPIRITRAKHIEFALRVTAALRAAGLSSRLVVTGPPDPHVPGIEAYFDQLRALRHDLGLDEAAFFVYEGAAATPGPLTIDLPVVGELYRLCDLVLMPSHREGFGMPVLEAGLADKPVFATAIPVADELGEGLVQRIAPDETPERVASRIAAWAEQDAAHRLRRRARQTYTWSSIFERMIQPLIAGDEPARQGART